MPNLTEQVEALEAAVDELGELDLSELEEHAQALQSRVLLRIHHRLQKQIAKLSESMGTSLWEIKDALDGEDGDEGTEVSHAS